MSNNEQNKEFWVETEIKAVELAIAAKALRTSFNTLSAEIMKSSYLDDKDLIVKVRRMQTEHKLFHRLADTLRESDYGLYEKELLS